MKPAPKLLERIANLAVTHQGREKEFDRALEELADEGKLPTCFNQSTCKSKHAYMEVSRGQKVLNVCNDDKCLLAAEIRLTRSTKDKRRKARDGANA